MARFGRVNPKKSWAGFRSAPVRRRRRRRVSPGLRTKSARVCLWRPTITETPLLPRAAPLLGASLASAAETRLLSARSSRAFTDAVVGSNSSCSVIRTTISHAVAKLVRLTFNTTSNREGLSHSTSQRNRVHCCRSLSTRSM